MSDPEFDTWFLVILNLEEAKADDAHLWDCTRVRNVPAGGSPEDRCDCGLPGQLRADVAAKRQVIELYQIAVRVDAPGSGTIRIVLLGALKALATGYADRPGYREEWKP